MGGLEELPHVEAEEAEDDLGVRVWERRGRGRRSAFVAVIRGVDDVRLTGIAQDAVRTIAGHGQPAEDKTRAQT
jgi:hypothetical protein